MVEKCEDGMLFNTIKVMMQYQNLKCFNIKGAGYTIKP